MPNAWKKASLARFIAGLRSKRTGSLVVQTGFPTSLADIIVKNHTRLKKPPRRQQKAVPISGKSDSDANPSSAAVRSPDDGLDRGCEVEVERLEMDPVEVGIERRDSGVWGLVAKVAPLVALAIGGKRVVAGMTIWAVCLWALEFLGVRFFGFLNLCLDAEKEMDSVVGGVDLGPFEKASPIREVGVWENGLGLNRSERILRESMERRRLSGVLGEGMVDRRQLSSDSREDMVERRQLSRDSREDTMERRKFSGVQREGMVERRQFSRDSRENMMERRKLSGVLRDGMAERRKLSGVLRDGMAERRQISGDSGEDMVERRKLSGGLREGMVERRQLSGDSRDDMPRRGQVSGVLRGGMVERRQLSGDSKADMVGKRQHSGVPRGGMVERSQLSGDSREDMEERWRLSGSSWEGMVRRRHFSGVPKEDMAERRQLSGDLREDMEKRKLRAGDSRTDKKERRELYLDVDEEHAASLKSEKGRKLWRKLVSKKLGRRKNGKDGDQIELRSVPSSALDCSDDEKRRKRWSKFVLKKLKRRVNGKDGDQIELGSTPASASDCSDVERKHHDIWEKEDEEDGDENVLIVEACNAITRLDLDDSGIIRKALSEEPCNQSLKSDYSDSDMPQKAFRENSCLSVRNMDGGHVGKNRLEVFWFFVFASVVLLGLVLGRLAALVLTVASCLIGKCAKTIWRK